MANDKQEKIDEAEMLLNPKAEEMCQYEEKNYPKCSSCPRTLDDQMFCKMNTIGWRLGQLDKAISQINYTLQQILAELKNK